MANLWLLLEEFHANFGWLFDIAVVLSLTVIGTFAAGVVYNRVMPYLRKTKKALG